MSIQIDRVNLARWLARSIKYQTTTQSISRSAHCLHRSFSSRSPSQSLSQPSNQSHSHPTHQAPSQAVPTSSLPFAHVTARDDLDDTSPQAIIATLSNIDRLSDRINQSIHQLTELSHTQASLSQSNNQAVIRSKNQINEDLRILKRKRATVMNSLAVLYDSAALAHRSYAERHLQSVSTAGSQMSDQLQALERVWNSVLKHGHPTTKMMTQLVAAYGREARRTKIRDLFDRWNEDRQAAKLEKMNESEKLRYQQEQQLKRDALMAQLEAGDVDNDIVPAKLQLLIMDRAEKWRIERLSRERSADQSATKRSLYPLLKLDTTAYNTLISSYLSSLSFSDLHPDSPVLAFPLSLLPHFKADPATYTTLMNLYCGMGDNKRVMQLFAEWRNKEREESMERGGRRLPPEQRQAKKQQRAYVYSIALRSLAQSPDLADVESMWSDLHALEQQNKIELTRPLYHSMLSAYAKHNNHEKIRAVAVEMRRRNMPMDEDSVCTVLKSMCEAGHTHDAIMMHQRLAHGTMGAAHKSRKTYLALFSHLGKHAVSQSELNKLFAAGMEDGCLRSPTAHRLKWTIDLRALPLSLLPLSLNYHLTSMLNVYMQTICEKGQKAANSLIPERGLLLILGKNRAQQQRERAAEFERHARDWDAALGGEDAELFSKSDDNKYSIIVDQFADEEEQENIDAMNALRVQGSYVQRYVKHLLVQEWPSIVAELTSETDAESKETQTATVNVHGVDLPITASLHSTKPHSSATLRVSRPGLLFWLQCRSCIVGNDATLYPPPPFTRAQALHWVTIQEKSVERLAKQHSNDPISLNDQLNEYKRHERVQLSKAASALNGKIEPTKLNGIPSHQEIEDAQNQPVYQLLPVKQKKSRKQAAEDKKPTKIRTPVMTSYLSNETLSFLQKQQRFAPQTKPQIDQLRQANESVEGDARAPSGSRTRERSGSTTRRARH